MHESYRNIIIAIILLNDVTSFDGGDADVGDDVDDDDDDDVDKNSLKFCKSCWMSFKLASRVFPRHCLMLA